MTVITTSTDHIRRDGDDDDDDDDDDEDEDDEKKGFRDGPTRSLSQGLTLAGRWPLRRLIAPRNKVSHDAACPAPHDFKHDQTSMAYVYT